MICHGEAEAHRIRARLEEWLAPRGLHFNEEKTKVVHLDEGFDFLGFTVRRRSGGKLIITPSTAACKRLRARLRAEVKSLHGASIGSMLHRLVPIVRGWTAYYRGGGVLDHLRVAGPQHVASDLSMGQASSSEEVDAAGQGPLLRRVPPVPQGPLGIR
ncbi:group II intron maturase-specific domain-containing protein [Streptomyces sp. NPDC002285]